MSWTTGTCKGGDSEEVAEVKGSEWSVQRWWEGYDNQGIYTKNSKAHDHLLRDLPQGSIHVISGDVGMSANPSTTTFGYNEDRPLLLLKTQKLQNIIDNLTLI